MLVFNRDKLEVGMIVHARTYGWVGKTIRKVLGCRGKNKVWGNHDAIIVEKEGMFMIGESVPPRAKLTLLEDYERGMRAGNIEVKVYEVVGANIKECRKAEKFWLSTVCGTFYDFLAFPRLFIKSWLVDLIPTETGWEWAHWCTEGVARAWEEGASILVWRKLNPTPWTTEKRVGKTLVDVTDNVMMEVDG